MRSGLWEQVAILVRQYQGAAAGSGLEAARSQHAKQVQTCQDMSERVRAVGGLLRAASPLRARRADARPARPDARPDARCQARQARQARARQVRDAPVYLGWWRRAEAHQVHLDAEVLEEELPGDPAHRVEGVVRVGVRRAWGRRVELRRMVVMVVTVVMVVMVVMVVLSVLKVMVIVPRVGDKDKQAKPKTDISTPPELFIG